MAARGCAPVAPPHTAPAADSPERPDLWLAGPRRAAAVVAAAADPTLSPSLTGLDPDLVSAVTELASPAEVLVALGGDERQVPLDGRNAYGLPLYDLAPHIRLSSCTATPPDQLTLQNVDRWRRRMLDDILSAAAPPDPASLHGAIAARLCRRLGLVDSVNRVVLAPSGTHVESVVTALAAGGTTRPLLMCSTSLRME